MRNHKHLVFTLAGLFVVGCAQTGSDPSGLNSQCGGDCSGSGGGGGGGGSGGGGGGTDVHVTAGLDIEAIGTGIYVGLSHSCSNLLNVSGNFDASLAATATFDAHDKSFVIDSVNDASLHISLGNGCTCEGISAQVCASLVAHASLDVDVASCGLFCDAKASVDAAAQCHGDPQCTADVLAKVSASCGLSCEADIGGHILGDASLTGDVNLNLNGGNHQDLLGLHLDVKLHALVDANGKILDTCD